MRHRLLMDVRQFVSYPLATGIQRTLLFLARHWPETGPIVDVGFAHGVDCAVAPFEAFRDMAEWFFGHQDAADADGGRASKELQRRLSGHVTGVVPPRQIPDRYTGYLLPQPAYQESIVDTLEFCSAKMGRSCAAIFYDSLPQTHPHLLPGPHQGVTSRYFLTMGRLESIAFISGHSRREFERRLRRSSVPNAFEMPLGADAFGSETAPVPTEVNFVVIGTVEPRKRHQLVLDTFERLWSSGHRYKLTFLGAPGWAPQEFIRRLRQAASENALFDWHENVTDAQLRAALHTATAALFVSQAEGYGLPPLEALALGCPVIVPHDLPSLENQAEGGQLRLDAISEQTLAEALEKCADPALNARLRAAIPELELPRWRDTVTRFAAWMGRAVEKDESGATVVDLMQGAGSTQPSSSEKGDH